MRITLKEILEEERVLYWLLIIFAAIPIIFPISLPIPITALTEKTFSAIEELEENSLVLYTVNMGVQDVPLSGPMMDAYTTHLVSLWEEKNIDIILWSTAIADAALVVESDVIPYFRDSGMEYGVDYINIGFIPGELTAVAALVNPQNVVSSDYYGNSLDQYDLWKRANHATDFDLVIIVAGNEVYYYMQFWQSPFGNRLLMTTGSPSLGPIAPYIDAGNVYGCLAGKTSAAEYEKLQGRIGTATGDIGSITFEHILFLALLFIGNSMEVYKRLGGISK